MRIIIDIDTAREQGRKKIRIRSRYYRNSDDCLRVENAGNLIYNEITRGVSFESFAGDLIFQHEGEVR